MIAEGSSSSSQTPVPRGGSSQPPSERDLLAERRARRAGESGERALLRRAETAEAAVETLEGHVASLQQRLEEAERDGRRTSELAERLENVEGALAAIRESHRRMAGTVSELKGVAMRLRAAIDAQPARESSSPSARPRSEEMADALAAAVERLRARAEESAAVQPDTTPTVPPVERTPHKHSMSLIGRWRLRRKQRRGR
jgi:chromosome segregation ATPase